jgi:hypothetical protein
LQSKNGGSFLDAVAVGVIGALDLTGNSIAIHMAIRKIGRYAVISLASISLSTQKK